MDQALVEIKVGPNSFPIKFKSGTGFQVNILLRKVFSKSNLNHPFDVGLLDLLFYVHGKHLRSCRDGQLT